MTNAPVILLYARLSSSRFSSGYISLRKESLLYEIESVSREPNPENSIKEMLFRSKCNFFSFVNSDMLLHSVKELKLKSSLRRERGLVKK